MDLKTWIQLQPSEKQEQFFRQAARFFSNRELKSIIDYITAGGSLYQAHLRAGVLDQYEVDLNNIKNSMLG